MAAAATPFRDQEAELAALLVDAQGHLLDALPDLHSLAHRRPDMGPLPRGTLHQIMHCLASAIEAVGTVSEASPGRRDEERALVAAAVAYMDAPVGPRPVAQVAG